MGQNESVEDMEWVTSYLKRLSNALIDHSASDELRAAFAIVARGVSTTLLSTNDDEETVNAETVTVVEVAATESVESQVVKTSVEVSPVFEDETDLNSWVYLVRLHDDRRAGGRSRLFVIPYSQEIDDYLKKPRRRKSRGNMVEDITNFCNTGIRRRHQFSTAEVHSRLDTSNRVFGTAEEDIFLGKLSAMSPLFIAITGGNKYYEDENVIYLSKHRRRYSVAQVLEYRVYDLNIRDGGPHREEFFIHPRYGLRETHSHRGYADNPYSTYGNRHTEDLSESTHSDEVPLYTPLPGERWGTNLPVPLPGVGNTSVS